MRCMKWQDFFSAISNVFVYERLGSGNEASAGEAPPVEVRAKSSPGTTK